MDEGCVIMICPLCKEKGIRVVSPYWLDSKKVDACRDCALKLNLKMIKVFVDKDQVPHWKVNIPAILERGLKNE